MPRLARLFPHHARHRPGQLAFYLAGLTALVCGAGLMMARAGNIPGIGLERRYQLALAFAMFLGWSFLWFKTRDVLLGRWARGRDRTVFSAVWLWPQFVPMTAALVWGIGHLGFGPGPAPLEAAPSSSPRIACYGGSSTFGQPLDGTSFTFPALLERRLRADGLGDARVWNQGRLAARIFEVQKWASRDLASSPPSHLVLYSVRNNLSLEYQPFARELERFLTAIGNLVPHVLMVEEMMFDSVYGEPRHDYEEVLRAYRDVARAHGVEFFSPRQLFREHREEFLFVDDDVHLTQYGNRLLAGALARWVVRSSEVRSADSVVPLPLRDRT